MNIKLLNGKDLDFAALVLDGVASAFFLPQLASPTVSAIRTIAQVNEDEFIEKLHAFLSEVDVPLEVKQSFVKALDRDAEKFFKRLVMVINHMDDKEKAVIGGKLFESLLLNKIDVRQFNKLSTVVKNVYIDTIFVLKDMAQDVVTYADGTKVYPKITSDEIEAQELLAAGLLLKEATSGNRDYKFSFLGIMLVENAF